MLRIAKRFLFTALTLLIIASVVGYLLLNSYVQQPLSLQETATVSVTTGSNLTRVLNKLDQQQLLDSDSFGADAGIGGGVKSKALLLYAQLTGRTDIKAGEYQLQPGITPDELLDKLVTGM